MDKAIVCRTIRCGFKSRYETSGCPVIGHPFFAEYLTKKKGDLLLFAAIYAKMIKHNKDSANDSLCRSDLKTLWVAIV